MRSSCDRKENAPERKIVKIKIKTIHLLLLFDFDFFGDFDRSMVFDSSKKKSGGNERS